MGNDTILVACLFCYELQVYFTSTALTNVFLIRMMNWHLLVG